MHISLSLILRKLRRRPRSSGVVQRINASLGRYTEDAS
jgi:hypothetical protein